MTEEAKLEANESGLRPTTPGWFVVNVRDAAWFDHDRFGAATVFESPDARFEQFGFNVRVLMPGQPNGMYHSCGIRGIPGLRYPVSELAKRHGASVEQETTEPSEAYADVGEPELRRPAVWDQLPWNR